MLFIHFYSPPITTTKLSEVAKLIALKDILRQAKNQEQLFQLCAKDSHPELCRSQIYLVETVTSVEPLISDYRTFNS